MSKEPSSPPRSGALWRPIHQIFNVFDAMNNVLALNPTPLNISGIYIWPVSIISLLLNIFRSRIKKSYPHVRRKGTRLLRENHRHASIDIHSHLVPQGYK
jgi:hypothetical protein